MTVIMAKKFPPVIYRYGDIYIVKIWLNYLRLCHITAI